MSQKSLIGYQKGDSFIHGLSAVSKLLAFLVISILVMVTYDTRLILGLGLLSLVFFKLSAIRLKKVSFVLALAIVFALLNVVMVYLFAPEYGVELYGSKALLWQGIGSYTVTSQELFYLLNLALKYFSTVPLALVFLMTTHPSQFASSLNRIGLSYRIAYAVSLTMRYIPDIQEEFYTIRLSQEARGLELSKKAPLLQRIKGNLALVTPLIFSSLERIDTVSTAMELRRFWKNKARTWYSYQAMKIVDWLVLFLLLILICLTIGLFFVNQGRFYNPWA
ncbi:energy-coupling factor transporter transmembrane component T family protein [Streptococcus sp. 20-1249]|uniref:energy-coupling factor transporter transmembrane component T family protein n=1 Tax=Streptococcus hepaticus TaxID=3349163 RepID=UPI00374A785E